MTEPQLTFEIAVASKPRHQHHLTDAQWYTVLLVQCALNLKLDAGDFLFTIMPPNPEIQAYFDARISPDEAAIALFGAKH